MSVQCGDREFSSMCVRINFVLSVAFDSMFSVVSSHFTDADYYSSG